MLGRIYKIFCDGFDKIYIGSTTKTLNQRLKKHVSHLQEHKKGKYRFTTSYIIIEKALELGVPCKIELLEECVFDCRNELLKIENDFIQNLKNLCVNRNLSYTGLTKLEYDKLYRQTNAKQIAEKRREKVTCDICQEFLRKVDILRHKQSKKCLFIKAQTKQCVVLSVSV